MAAYFLRNAGAWSSNNRNAIQAVQQLAPITNATALLLPGTIHHRLMTELSSMSENNQERQTQTDAHFTARNTITLPTWQAVVDEAAATEAASAAEAKDIACLYGRQTLSSTRAQ